MINNNILFIAGVTTFYISSYHNHTVTHHSRTHNLVYNGEPIYTHEPNDSEGDEEDSTLRKVAHYKAVHTFVRTAVVYWSPHGY